MFHDIERWKRYFAEAVRFAEEDDLLSDLDYFDMGLGKALKNAPSEDEENVILEAFANEKSEMFRKVFGEDWYKDRFPYEPEENEDG